MVSLEVLRHSVAHVLAIAVKELYPEVKLGIGPSIEDGFYYDFDNLKISDEDLIKIEKKMWQIVKKKLKFEKKETSIVEAKKLLKNETYKLDLLKEIKKPSFYKTGDFIDLCAGPHVKNTNEIKAFKLMKIAGAYWKGDSKNKMLTRIYGVAFNTRKELDDYLKNLKKTKLREHRKIGKEMNLFSFHEEAPGMPFFHDKGSFIWDEIVKFVKQKMIKRNYEINKTPILLNQDLWVQSGHWEHYKDNMYFTQIDKKKYAVKPMNCPGNILIFKNKLYSYKELPIRAGEFGLVHRHELSGVLNGLFRVRMFTQDDAHIYCMQKQMKDELKDLLNFVDEVYSTFGFDYHLELSTRPKKFLGDVKLWNIADQTLKEVLEASGKEFKSNEGDGAFYGPKIDFHIKDCIKRTWQCGTIQLDFQMPERFDLNYVGEDGNYHRPVMIHRTIIGSVERFLGILLEHYAGKLPLWLSSVHVKLVTVNSRNVKFAKKVKEKMEKEDLRVELDERTESIGRKVRDAQIERIPLIVTIGDKEEKGKKIAVRDYHGKVNFGINIDKFIKKVVDDIEKKENSVDCDGF